MTDPIKDLASQFCKPLNGVEHRLSAELIARGLMAVPSWQVLEHQLVREFKFSDYYRSIAFVNAIAFIAHAQDHHPDLSVHYNRVQVRFSTHDVGGLSLNDFICAAKVDALFTS